MLNHENFAITLGRLVDLLRSSPRSINEQKAGLRALVALTKLGGATVAVTGRGLWVEATNVPPTLPFISALAERMLVHALHEVRIAQSSSAADLLRLCRTLASDPEAASTQGTDRQVVESGGGALSVAVMSVGPEAVPEGRRSVGVTQAFSSAEIASALDRSEAAPAEEAAPPAASSPPATVAPPAAVPEAAPGEPPPAPKRARDRERTPLEAAIARLTEQPGGTDILGRLDAVVAAIPETLQAGDVDQAVAAIETIIHLERGTPDDSSQRRSYGIALNRMLTPSTLEHVARLVLVPTQNAQATRVMRRAGADGTEVLMRLLAEAPAAAERRAYFNALREGREGSRYLINMLGHPEWYVVRNVADLIAELQIEDAVPALGKAAGHDDVRVRKAAFVALARIGTPWTVDLLRRAFRDPDVELRILVAGAIGGRRAGALAMPLVTAIQDERNVDVQCEYHRALGRIGTPDAIQALIKGAQPGGRLLGRRPTVLRLAAIDGLRAVATPAAVGTLEGLVGDRDREVARAAQEALEDLKGK